MSFPNVLRSRSRHVVAAASLTGLALSLSVYSYNRQPIRADSEVPIITDDDKAVLEDFNASTKSPSRQIFEGAGKYSVYVWGGNRTSTLLPSSYNLPQTVKTPRPSPYLGNTPLKDLILAEQFGACADAKGDVWIWGDGYASQEETEGKASRSLRGKKISSLKHTSQKIFALSPSSGKIYAFSSSRELQIQPHPEDQTRRAPWWSLGGLWGWTDPGVDYVELGVEGGLQKGEKFTQISTGSDHLLALTSKGRTFSLPTSSQGNSHFQLGTRTSPPTTPSISLPPPSDIRYSTTLTPIPSLSSIPIAHIASSSRTSFCLSPSGRVLGFGANEFGQIGLGALVAVEVVPVPTEVVLARGYKGGTTIKCLDVQAGGNNTFFTVERSMPGEDRTYVDLLATGSGVVGTLGNGLWSSANGSPVKVKTVSGLQEYSESVKAFVPVDILHLSVSSSPTPHAITTLHTVRQSDARGVADGLYGNDVWVWGAGADHQLGNGKRSNLAVAQHIPPLKGEGRNVVEGPNGGAGESSLSSGTLSPMPHSRLQLHSGKAHAYDLDGKLIKKNCKVEETILAGWNSTAVYWKIVD